MKNILFVLCLTVVLSIQAFSQKSTLFIYHFYSHERCPGDQRIELLTIQTLDSLFSKELQSKQIRRQSLNFEEKRNQKIVKKLNVSTIALVFRIAEPDGKEIVLDLTDWAFANVWNELKFKKELAEKIREALLKLK